MVRINRARAALLCCAAAGLVSSVSAIAQEAGDETTDDNVIIVTAARDQRELKDVPGSVDVTTGEELQKFNLFDTKDIGRLSPGLELTNTTGRNNTTTLRGITFDPDQGTGPAVQTYFNEAPADPQYVFTALYDIQQIEVLRGPQGLLRGLSAPAGTITITSRRPNFAETDGYAQATGTSRDAYNLQAGMAVPLSETLAIRVAGLIDGNRLNHVRNVTRDQRSRSRTESGRATLGWRPSADFEAYLTYQYLQADNRQFPQVFGPGNRPVTLAPFIVGQQPIAPGFSVPIAIFVPSGDTRVSGPAIAVKDYQGVSQQLDRYKNRFHFVNLNAEWDLGGAKLGFIGAHTYALLNQQRDLDPGNAVVDPTPNSFVRIPNKRDTAELRLTSDTDSAFGWGVSGFYERRTGTVTVDQDANSYSVPVALSTGLFIPINTHVVVPVDTENYSIAGNLTYRTGPLTIEGGIRYSRLHQIQTTTVFVTSPGGQAVVPVGGGANLLFPVGPINSTIVGVPPALSRNTEKPITGGINVRYAITPEINLYAAYGHAFRAGSAGVATPVGISTDLILTQPEKTDSFEAGVKGSALDRRLNFSLSAFYQKIDGFLSRFDGIVYNCPDVNGVCGAPGSAAINNATDVPATNGGFSFNYNGDAEVKGIEVTLDARPTDNWDIGLNAAYTRARYQDALLPCNDFAGTGTPNQTGAQRITGTGNVSYCMSSGRLAEVPDFSLSANTEVRFPVGAVTPFVAALYTMRPSFSSSRVNFDYPSRNLLDLYLGVRDDDGRWELNGFAKNVFNQRKITSIALGDSNVGPYNSGYRSINVTAPREFGVTAKYNF